MPMQMCNALLLLTSSDTSALQLLTLVLRELKREKHITGLYSAASAAHPRDVDLLKQLFGAYVR